MGKVTQNQTRRYNELFAGNRRAENGVPVDFYEPVNNEILDFSADDVAESIDFWKFTLVGRVVGARVPLEGIKRFVQSHWLGEPNIHVAGQGIYLFRFNSQLEMEAAYGGGPWMVKGLYPLNLKIWSPGMSLDPSSLQSFPVWVKLPNLDLQFWNNKMIGKISRFWA